MANKTMTTSAVIISKDAKFSSILTDRKPNQNDQLIITSEDGINNLSTSKYDVYIYDVDLSIDKLQTTLTTISKLSRHAGKNILILAGKKNDLSLVLQNKSVASIISRTISKPFSYMQLLLAIKSCTKGSKQQVHQHIRKPSLDQSRVVVLSLVAGILFISIFSWFHFQKSELKTIPSNLNEIIESPVTNSQSKLNINTSQKADQLNKLALSALNDGRLTEPSDHNAVHYLNLLNEIDPYNISANQTHIKLFDLLEASYLEISSKGNDTNTKAILNSILKLEPYNHKYGIHLIELKERIYRSTLSKNK